MTEESEDVSDAFRLDGFPGTPVSFLLDHCPVANDPETTK